ncbi:cytochrome P450 [Auricularia subglabra TFB-10046 SS5]|nr:cytochrome P450 [Auricularia subglabra TFB-10046 SS5]
MDEVGIQILRDKKAAVLAEAGPMGKDLPRGKDLMSILVRANLAADLHPSLRLSDNEVLAQIPMFLFAGYETTSNTTAWAVYSLTKHPETQAKLRAELQLIGTEAPSLDLLNSLLYLDHVVRETIRLYNVATYITREAFKDDLIPLGREVNGRDGTVLTHIGIQEGDQVIVPIWLVNRSKHIWGADTNEFWPERWENVPDEASAIPGITPGLISFVGGPRACIGHRFAVAEIKALLFHIVRGFELRLAVEPNEIWARSGPLLHPQLRSDNSVQLPIIITPIA